jgi:hypothetical protein
MSGKIAENCKKKQKFLNKLIFNSFSQEISFFLFFSIQLET